MDAQKVDVIIMTIKDKIPEEKIMILRERLLNVDDSKAAYISAMPMKSPITALVLSIIFGHLGVDRFYIGDTGLGVAHGLCHINAADSRLLLRELIYGFQVHFSRFVQRHKTASFQLVLCIIS